MAKDGDELGKKKHLHGKIMYVKIALNSRPAFTLTKSQYLSRHEVRSVKDFSALVQFAPPPAHYL